MIKDDKERAIGKLTSINSDKFTVELLNQSINFTINGFEDIYQYAQINGYVILPYQDFYIVAEIFGVRERDSDIKWQGEKEQILNKSNSVKYLDINPIGTIKKGKFNYGVSIFPTLYTDVLYIKKDELDTIFEYNNDTIPVNDTDDSTRLKLLEIGTSTIFPDYKVKININDFFGAHSSVLGNTGSGKSCTIASMIQTLFKKDNYSAVGSSLIFFDVNGEYHKAFSQLNNSDIDVRYFSVNEMKSHDSFEYKKEIKRDIQYDNFKLPHWFLNIDEWALLLQASERTQLPILRSSLGILSLTEDKYYNHIVAKLLYHIIQNENPGARGTKASNLIQNYSRTPFNKDILSKHHFHSQFGTFQGVNPTVADTNQKNFFDELNTYIIDEFYIPSYSSSKVFDFKKLEEVIEIAILYEEAHGNKQIRDYCSSLITRYKSLKDRTEFDFLTKNSIAVEKDLFLDNLLGVQENKKKTQITIIDLNSVEDEVVEVISCVITRMVFERLKTLAGRNTFPVNLVLEEAHRYIAEHKNSHFGEANKIFERVAKEGRKYGLFLMVSSQRPSELSKTVLSQCSNFIVHRIQNPDDLNHIRQMTPHISSNILYRLPSIPTQHALVFGSSVQIPTLFKVNDASPLPNSANSDITKHWFIPKSSFEK